MRANYSLTNTDISSLLYLRLSVYRTSGNHNTRTEQNDQQTHPRMSFVSHYR